MPPRQAEQSAWVTPTHIVASPMQVTQANSTVKSLQSSAPEPPPEPWAWQSTEHVAAVSVPLHIRSPQNGAVAEPEPEPVFEPPPPPPFEPFPQSAGQLFTSFAAQVPSPQLLLLVEASGAV